MKFIFQILTVVLVLIIAVGIAPAIAQPGLPSPPDQAPMALSALLALGGGTLGYYLLKNRK